MLGVERLGLGLGAHVEGERRVLVARHLPHAAEVLGDLLVDAVPAALLVELDAAVGEAAQHTAAARVVGLESNQQGHGLTPFAAVSDEL